MWKYFASFLAGVLAVAASSFSIVDSLLSMNERRIANSIAASLAADGVDVSSILDAESGPAALLATKSLLRAIPEPTASNAPVIVAQTQVQI